MQRFKERHRHRRDPCRSLFFFCSFFKPERRANPTPGHVGWLSRSCQPLAHPRCQDGGVFFASYFLAAAHSLRKNCKDQAANDFSNFRVLCAICLISRAQATITLKCWCLVRRIVCYSAAQTKSLFGERSEIYAPYLTCCTLRAETLD